MRKKYLIGVVAVIILVLAVWLVPLALAAAGSSTAPSGSSTASPDPAQGSGTECPFLQAHSCPYLHPDGSTDGARYQTYYY